MSVRGQCALFVALANGEVDVLSCMLRCAQTFIVGFEKQKKKLLVYLVEQHAI